MKKITFLFSVLLLSVSLFAQGISECTTIAEIKALNEGTTFNFKGSAVMTYFDGGQGMTGIILQDATGAILLDNQKFGSSYGTSNFAKYKPGKKVVSFTAVYHTLKDKLPSATFTDQQVNELKIDGTSTFSPVVLTVDELFADIHKYAGMSVQITAKVNNGKIFTSDNKSSLTVEGAKIYKATDNISAIPAEGTFTGYVAPYYKPTDFKFVIYGLNNQKPVSFKNLQDLKAFYFSQCQYKEPISILDNLLVTSVGKDFVIVNGGSGFFARGIYVNTSAQKDLNLKVGDLISGLKGVFVAPVYQYKIVSGSKMTLSADAQINVVSHDNPVKVSGSNKSFSDLSNTYFRNYEYLLFDFSTGVITSEAGKYYFTQGEKKILLSVASDPTGAALAKYLGKEYTITALFSTLNGPELVLSDPSAIHSTTVEFNTIAEMQAAGTAADGVTYVLKGEVLVSATTPILADPVYPSQKDSYIFVEDATGAMCVKSIADLRTKFQKGDKISNLQGLFSYEYEAATLVVTSEQIDAIAINSRDNELNITDVTLVDLKGEGRSQYTNRLVRLSDVYYIKNGQFDGKPCSYVADNLGDKVLSYWRFNLPERNYTSLVGIFDTYSMQGDGENFYIVNISLPKTPKLNVTKNGNSYTVSPVAQQGCTFKYAVYGKTETPVDPAKNGTVYTEPLEITGSNENKCVSFVAFDGKWNSEPVVEELKFEAAENTVDYLKAHPGEEVTFLNLKVVSSIEDENSLSIEGSNIWVTNNDASIKGKFPYITDVKGVYTEKDGFVISQVTAVKGFQNVAELVTYFQSNELTNNEYLIAKDLFGVAFIEHLSAGDVYYIDCKIQGMSNICTSTFSSTAKPSVGVNIKNAKVIVKDASAASLSFDFTAWEKHTSEYVISADEYPISGLAPNFYTTVKNVVWDANTNKLTDATGSCTAKTQIESLKALGDGATKLNVIGFYTPAEVFYITTAVPAEGGSIIVPEKGHYLTISQLLEANPDNADVFLDNPVKVTCILKKSSTSTVYLQDLTGAIYMDVDNASVESVAVGDVISGVKGYYRSTGSSACVLLATSNNVTNLTLTKHTDLNINIEPVLVTINDLVSSPAKYASRLVRIENVEMKANPYNSRSPFLIQGIDTLDYNNYFWGKVGVTKTYPKANITGVCDYKSAYGSPKYGCSILPVNQASVVEVKEGVGTDVENNTENEVVVFVNSSNIYVQAPEGSMIEVYTIQGQRVYAEEAVSSLTAIENINSNIAIVRVNNQNFKVILK